MFVLTSVKSDRLVRRSRKVVKEKVGYKNRTL